MIDEHALDTHDVKAMRRWLARLLEMPASMFSDDTLEEVRWDIAHYFFEIGCAWNAGMVIAGNLTPYQHNRRTESDAVYAEVEALYSRSPKPTKPEFIELLKHRYDCLNMEEQLCSTQTT